MNVISTGDFRFPCAFRLVISGWFGPHLLSLRSVSPSRLSHPSLSQLFSPCRFSISLHSTSLCSSSLIAVSSPAAFVGASNGPSLVWFDALSAEIRAISFHFVHLCCSRHRCAPVFLHRSVVAGSICRRFQQSKSRLSLAPWAAAIRDFFGSGFIYTQSVCVCLCVRACVSLRFLNVAVVLHGCFRVVCCRSCRYTVYSSISGFRLDFSGCVLVFFEALKKLSFIFVEDLSSAVGNWITAAARVSICASLRVVDAISLAIVFSSYYCPSCVSVFLCRQRSLFPAPEESPLWMFGCCESYGGRSVLPFTPASWLSRLPCTATSSVSLRK